MSDPIRIRRDQLESFLDRDEDAIRAFESLFRKTDSVPNAVVEEVTEDFTFSASRNAPRIVQVETGANDLDCFLPPGGQLIFGDEFEYNKVDSGTGTATLKCQGSDTIDGVAAATGVVLYSQGNKIRVRWTGTVFTVVELQSNGSNGNGSWQLFANGVLQQLGQDEVSSFPDTATLPIAFVNLDYGIIPSWYLDTGDQANRTVNIRQPSMQSTVTTFQYYVSSGVSETTGIMEYIAIGRWRA